MTASVESNIKTNLKVLHLGRVLFSLKGTWERRSIDSTYLIFFSEFADIDCQIHFHQVAAERIWMEGGLKKR